MRILILRQEPPWPLSHGGRLRCYELARRLASRHDVLLCAARPGPEPLPPDTPFEVRILDREPPVAHTLRLDRSERYFGIDLDVVERARRVVASWRPDVVVGANYQSMSTLSRLPDVPTLCDLQDDEVLHRWLELTRGVGGQRWSDLKALAMITAYERRHLRRVNGVVVNARADRAWCRRVTGHRRVWVVPHGVDCQHYQPADTAGDAQTVAFWGGLDFGPNRGALRFFGDQVWPNLKAAEPAARWLIMGPGTAPDCADLRARPGVEWLGFVEDIRPHVAAAGIAVVPMRTGAGIKNKIMEAWAMGRAVLCTPRALGDLPGRDGHNVVLASSGPEMVAAARRLMNDHAWRADVAAAGRRTAEQACSWEAAAAALETCCRTVIDDGNAGAGARPTVALAGGSS